MSEHARVLDDVDHRLRKWIRWPDFDERGETGDPTPTIARRVGTWAPLTAIGIVVAHTLPAYGLLGKIASLGALLALAAAVIGFPWFLEAGSRTMLWWHTRHYPRQGGHRDA